MLTLQGSRVLRSPAALSPPGQSRCCPSTLSWFWPPTPSWSVCPFLPTEYRVQSAECRGREGGGAWRPDAAIFVGVLLLLTVVGVLRADQEEHGERLALRGPRRGLRVPPLPLLDGRHDEAHVLQQVLAARGSLDTHLILFFFFLILLPVRLLLRLRELALPYLLVVAQLSSITRMFSNELTMASAWLHLLLVDLFAARCAPL